MTEYTSIQLTEITQLALHRLAFSAPDSGASRDMRDRALAALRRIQGRAVITHDQLTEALTHLAAIAGEHAGQEPLTGKQIRAALTAADVLWPLLLSAPEIDEEPGRRGDARTCPLCKDTQDKG